MHDYRITIPMKRDTLFAKDGLFRIQVTSDKDEDPSMSTSYRIISQIASAAMTFRLSRQQVTMFVSFASNVCYIGKSCEVRYKIVPENTIETLSIFLIFLIDHTF